MDLSFICASSFTLRANVHNPKCLTKCQALQACNHRHLLVFAKTVMWESKAAIFLNQHDNCRIRGFADGTLILRRECLDVTFGLSRVWPRDCGELFYVGGALVSVRHVSGR